MKKNICVVAMITISAMGASMVTSCNSNNKENQEKSPVQEVNHNLKFVSYNYDMIAERDTDSVSASGGKYVRYQGEGILPEVLGDQKVKLLRDSLEKIAGITFTDYHSPVPVTESRDHLTDLSPVTTEACSYISNNVSASLVNPRVIVFEVENENYECPAAHGMNNVISLNYCLNDGKILLFEDLIKSDGKAKMLELLKQNIKNSDIPLIVGMDEIQIPEEFSVVQSGIDFIYQPYDIAPYSEGSVKVSVSLGDLMQYNLLTDEGKYVFNVSDTK